MSANNTNRKAPPVRNLDELRPFFQRSSFSPTKKPAMAPPMCAQGEGGGRGCDEGNSSADRPGLVLLTLVSLLFMEKSIPRLTIIAQRAPNLSSHFNGTQRFKFLSKSKALYSLSVEVAVLRKADSNA